MDLNAQCVYDPRLGIVLYKNALVNSPAIIDRLENGLKQSSNPKFKWSLATTGDEDTDTSYRNCSDFKIHPDNMVQENTLSHTQIMGLATTLQYPASCI